MDLSKFARYPSLQGKAVFVTGGGSGIGAAIVESFVDQGARVAFVDIEDEWSRKLCDDLKQQYGVAPQYIRCDIRDVAALQADNRQGWGAIWRHWRARQQRCQRHAP